MGHAVEEAGGRVDKFIGDGIMALFGIDEGAAAGCRNALEAARLMSLRLDELNREVAADIDTPLRMGIGIHVGPVIVGEMGYGPATQLTAVGDAVNTASRLETMSKEFECELVLSEEVATQAGTDLSAYPHHEVEIRGRRQPLGVRAVERGKMLAAPGIA
jgi:adenylate cyclase